jgi:hypothetical protein
MLPVINVPAGSRFVSGRLDHVKVSACAGEATSVVATAIPSAEMILINLFIFLLL